MPTRDDGTYTPLTNQQKTDAVNYGENLVRQGNLTQIEIVQRMGARFGFDNSDYLATFNLARQAERAVAAADAIQRQPGTTPSPSQIPNVPSDPQDRGQYIHDVLIQATDPATGETYTFREEIITSTPMGMNDLQSYVDENRDTYLRRGGSPRVVPSSRVDAVNLSIILLDIGRGT